MTQCHHQRNGVSHAPKRLGPSSSGHEDSFLQHRLSIHTSAKALFPQCVCSFEGQMLCDGDHHPRPSSMPGPGLSPPTPKQSQRSAIHSHGLLLRIHAMAKCCLDKRTIRDCDHIVRLPATRWTGVWLPIRAVRPISQNPGDSRECHTMHASNVPRGRVTTCPHLPCWSNPILLQSPRFRAIPDSRARPLLAPRLRVDGPARGTPNFAGAPEQTGEQGMVLRWACMS